MRCNVKVRITRYCKIGQNINLINIIILALVSYWYVYSNPEWKLKGYLANAYAAERMVEHDLVGYVYDFVFTTGLGETSGPWVEIHCKNSWWVVGRISATKFFDGELPFCLSWSKTIT